MKKLISILLAILILLAAFNITAYADVPTESIELTQLGTTDTYFKYDLETKTLTISGNGATPNFSSNGQGQPWYEWRNEYIDKIVIEDGVTSLGSYLFYQVQASEISLPESLSKIGGYVFYSNQKLTNITLPFGLTSIGSYAFRYCAGLTSISISDTVKTIGTKAFEGCNALKEIEIPYSVTSLSSNCFLNCLNLESVKFQSGTSSIKISDYCFLGCPNLKELTVPINATMGKCSFGYKTQTSKYAGTNLNVYSPSDGYNYALSNTSYTLYDKIDVETAVGYTNTYTSDNINKTYTYRFVPKTSEKYNIYTRGDCDVDAVITNNGIEVATADDIANNDTNFCASIDMIANEEYLITVRSIKAIGTYTMWIYPDDIESINIKSKPISTQAVKDMKTIDDNLLSDFVITIDFENGSSDKVYYQNDFFNGTYLKQKESSLTCGETTGYIEIGDVYNSYPLTIEHTYESKEIGYTVDSPSYTQFTCVLCGDNYGENYVDSPAIKIQGRVVFAEDIRGNHNSNKAYPYIDKIVINDTKLSADRTYYVDENGYFTINSFNNFDAELFNIYGKNIKFSLNVDEYEPYTVVDYGTIVINAYDFNNDKKVNAKDYAIYLKEKKEILPNGYMEFFSNCLI